jgi:hypothetical protein
MPMARYLILGAGKFGRLALTRLARHDAGASFVVVDHAPEALAAARALAANGTRVVAGEAVNYLVEHLQEDGPWDWLIPMAPIHLAFAWLWRAHLANVGWEMIPVPAVVERCAPLRWRGPQGELYLSRAAHLCPDDCPEPEVCPISGEPRDPPLYEELASLEVPGFRVAVVASRQLAPGVGGYPSRRLPELAQEVAGWTGGILVATACRCHGVVHAARRQPGRPR